MAKAGADSVKKLLESRKVNYFHELSVVAVDAMERDVKQAIDLFCPHFFD